MAYFHFQVSSSGVTLSHQKGHGGSLENIPYADGTEETDGNYETLEEIDSIDHHKTGGSGRDYVAQKYPDLTIIDGRYSSYLCILGHSSCVCILGQGKCLLHVFGFLLMPALNPPTPKVFYCNLDQVSLIFHWIFTEFVFFHGKII